MLPVSPDDERLRFALYRALYNFDSPLCRVPHSDGAGMVDAVGEGVHRE